MSQSTTTQTTANLSPEPLSLGDRVTFVAFIFGGLFLACLTGIVMSIFQAPPYQWTRNALEAATALNAQQKLLNTEYPRFLWKDVRNEKSGLTLIEQERMQPGLTAYSNAGNSEVVLLSELGEVVHRWSAAFSTVWPSPLLEKSFLPDDRVFVRAARVESNGDLLAVYETSQSTPNGIGMAKLDKDSNVIWSFDGNCHHDFDVDENGNVFVLTHECLKGKFPKTMFNLRVNIEDFITVLSPDGKELKKFSLLKALVESPYYLVSLVRRDAKGDVLHANTVNLVTKEFADHYEGIEAGHLIVCFRNYNLVTIVDPKTEKIVWAVNGPWFFPHDPDPLENGNLLIFDNASIEGNRICSRVLEFDPREKKIVWQYAGTKEDPLMSEIRSTSQRLENGNTLICESNGGRILEVTREGKKVWEFVTPTRGGENEDLIPIMAAAERYPLSDVPFVHGLLGRSADFEKEIKP